MKITSLVSAERAAYLDPMRPGSSWLGALLVLVSGVGCNEEPSPNSPSSPDTGSAGMGVAPGSNVDIEGFWATYANDMDGTVVSLQADGNVITGRGCLAGWQEPIGADSSNQCGEITGTVDGDRLTFQFYFGAGPWDTYGVSVQPIASGGRMNGEHYYFRAESPAPPAGATKANHWKGPVTLFRPPLAHAADKYWPFSPAPPEVRSALASVGQLTLLDDAPAGKFTPGTSYELQTAWGGLQGDLGVFAPVDVTYEYPQAGLLIVHAGPVAQLDPNAPVSLKIEVRDARLVGIEAELATGEMPTFAP